MYLAKMNSLPKHHGAGPKQLHRLKAGPADIVENCLNWTHLRHNSRLSQKQNEFFDAFIMAHQSSYRHIQAVMNNFKLIVLDYLAAKKSSILDWRRDFCDWSINSHSIWRVMPFRHLTEYNTLWDNVLRKQWCSKGGGPGRHFVD